ncbi:DNA primase regulatory subunit PriL [Methanoculleus sp. FWC-SCC1]|uniref:DNA primase large subunit PriL n=1 Tax=Methanoculleus frigidifontis TaxID=2584085 RepID=A0ABT8M6G2_9EURY|nr:DNA primase regulatory subunit PriL [Methanoculleus sp. FWC-SCC1]MDN7023527.1 DNA primase regulatory subunit PriL [Methanoculleus sp. FWC-SCC1]
MVIAFDYKDLAKYPFLKESEQLVRKHFDSLDRFLSGPRGDEALQRAKERILDAIDPKWEFREEDAHRLPPEIEIASYALARILVSCAGDRLLPERLTRYEAIAVSHFLESEEAEKKRYVAQFVGLDLAKSSLPVPEYIELITQLRDARWRLINRDIQSGLVRLEAAEYDELLRERIRVVLLRNLPLRVPSTLCERFAPIIDEIGAAYQQQMLEQFGAVEEEAFPPCIGGLIGAVTAGTNLTHMGRFAITAFLHTIGMNTFQIGEVFARAPDFDPEKTMYQVEHISGSSGTAYTPPSCATMRTFGLCLNRDAICEQVNHPLSYYRRKKKKIGKPKQA